MAQLTGKNVAFVLTDGFEDSELTSPWKALEEAGATNTLIAPDGETVTGKNGHEQRVDAHSGSVSADDFDALVLPGGVVNSDHIRMDQASVAFVQQLDSVGKPIGAICHGAWILTDAKALRGRTITSYPSLKTDLINAGATWVDEEVVCDQGLVSSRTPDDLPAFNDKLVEEIAEGIHPQRAG